MRAVSAEVGGDGDLFTRFFLNAEDPQARG